MSQSLMNTVVVPNSTLSPWSACDYAGTAAMGTYSNADSYHPGGTNTLFCDGSVKAIKSTIAQNTWWAWGRSPMVKSSALTSIDGIVWSNLPTASVSSAVYQGP